MSNSPRSEPGSADAQSRIVRVEDLRDSERDAMHELLQMHFQGVTRDRFEADLEEKESVVLLYGNGTLGGFSTLMRLRAEVGGQTVVAFYSGDTIVAEAFQGFSELSRLWSRHTFALAEELRREEPDLRIYWLLISAGYKTYRFLPLFFRRFYPSPDSYDSDFERSLADTLAKARFGQEYHREDGVVRFSEPTPLRPGVAEVDESRRRDPYVAFFLETNPGHDLGDYLVCTVELHPGNATAAGRRMLGLPRE